MRVVVAELLPSLLCPGEPRQHTRAVFLPALGIFDSKDDKELMGTALSMSLEPTPYRRFQLALRIYRASASDPLWVMPQYRVARLDAVAVRFDLSYELKRKLEQWGQVWGTSEDVAHRRYLERCKRVGAKGNVQRRQNRERRIKQAKLLLVRYAGNITKVARRMEVTRQTVYIEGKDYR